jgi:hypothetical protein
MRELNKLAAAGAVLAALALMPQVATAQEYSDVQNNGNLHLGGYGNFFIGGDLATCPTPPSPATNSSMCSGTVNPGLHMINQMYVQFMLPQAQNGKKHNAIGIVHGCCLSTKSWQTTPDGRMGWDEYFVRQGFSTYMMDQVGRARSGFDPVAYNSVRTGLTPCVPTGTTSCPQNPSILIASDQFAWNVFRWGTTTCTTSPCSSTTIPHPDLKFPIQTIGVGPNSNTQFYNMVIPDMSSTLTASGGSTPNQMGRLATKVGGMILMGHSQSSGFPTRAALASTSGCFPWTSAAACKVKGIIQLETGCVANLTPDQVATLSHIPILIVDGDYFKDQRPPASCVTMMNQVNGAGGDMEYALLPSLTPGSLYPGSPGPMPGIEHMMMIGTKNIEVANLLIGWINSRGL